MPYLIRNLEDNARLNLVSTITVGDNVGDYVEFKISGLAGNSSNVYRILGLISGYGSLLEVKLNVVSFRSTTQVDLSGFLRPAENIPFTVKIERTTGGPWQLIFDGTVVSSEAGGNIIFSQFLNFSSSLEAFHGDCYYIEACTDGTGVATNRWENTTGTGAVLVDQIGTNDATQAGTWPADDSEWVFYSTGPVTPINPSITSLLATSARLNWEQG